MDRQNAVLLPVVTDVRPTICWETHLDMVDGGMSQTAIVYCKKRWRLLGCWVSHKDLGLIVRWHALHRATCRGDSSFRPTERVEMKRGVEQTDADRELGRREVWPGAMQKTKVVSGGTESPVRHERWGWWLWRVCYKAHIPSLSPLWLSRTLWLWPRESGAPS